MSLQTILLGMVESGGSCGTLSHFTCQLLECSFLKLVKDVGFYSENAIDLCSSEGGRAMIPKLVGRGLLDCQGKITVLKTFMI